MKTNVLRLVLMMVVLFAMVNISYATDPPVAGTPITTVSAAQRGCGIATIPISVTQFSNIASVSLTLYYNPNYLIYDSATVANMPLYWTFSFGTAATSNPNQRKLIMGAFWDGFTSWNMEDNGEIILAYFHTPGYTNGADTSSLRWDLTDPIACQYGSSVGSGGIPPYVLAQNSSNYVNGLFSPISGFPSLICPGNITQAHDPGVCSAVVNWMTNVNQALPPGMGSPNASTTASFIWQSFTAESSGILTGIGLTAYDVIYPNPQNGNWTYKIFKGEGIAGCLLYSGTYNATSKNVNGDTILLRIPKALGLYTTQGDKYTFEILGGCPVGCSWPGDICVDLLAYYNTGWHNLNGLYLDNTGMCQNTPSIIVRYPVDDLAVLFTTFIDVIPSTGPGSTMAVSDGSGGCGIKYLATPEPSGSVFPNGPTTVTYTATDYAGNVATCHFTVTITGPAITSVTGAARCGPGIVNLSAVASPSNAIIHWYSSLTGGDPLNTGPTYSPNLTTTTTYYLDATDIGENGGCTSTPRVPVTGTIYTLPVPTISGVTPVCAGYTGDVFTTQSGQTNYIWTVSGGIVTAGGTSASNTVTVNWPTAGNWSVTVNYTDVHGCTSPTPAEKPVTVNPLPVPTISGVTPVCAGYTGDVFTTESGKTNYIWVVTGGTITAGGTSSSNTVTVNWPTPGNWSVTVNYTDGNGCTASSPAVKTVTVNPLPVPTISGPTSVCANSVQTYTTQPGMTNYVWTVTGGTDAPPPPPSNSITVTWGATGTGHITVTYTDPNGCNPVSPGSQTITINPLPVPTISGPTSVCANSVQTYTTQPGMTNYVWTVTGGTDVPPPPGNSITVTWGAAGTGQVTVTYTDPNGCNPVSPGTLSVTINALPVATISGPTSVCANSSQNYITQSGMSNYIWTITGGTDPPPPPAPNSLSVEWGPAGQGHLTVTYTDPNGCHPASPGSLNVTINPYPAPVISGPTTVCATSAGNIYSTPLSDGDTYSWFISGGTITAGAGTHTVTVTWDSGASGYLTVTETTPAGCSITTQHYNVTINPLPLVTAASMEYSLNPTGPWSMMNGTLSAGYNMCLDPGVTFYYLDINSMTVSQPLMPNMLNSFTLSQTGLPANWFTYWASKGVTASALSPTWQYYMWPIINGQAPIFYIDNVSGVLQLIDALTYQLGGGLTPLRVYGDYPQGNYTYYGSVEGTDGCASAQMYVNMRFNTIPSITLVPVNPTCPRSNNGTITASPSGGNPGYSYSWNTNPVQTGAEAINLGPGTYTVTVTDAAGCMNTASATLVLQDQPAPIVPPPGSSTVACVQAVTTPVPPVVYDACGNLIIPTGPVVVNNMNGCQGTIVYTYTYTDYQPKSTQWSYTYTVAPPLVYFLPVSDITTGCGQATTSQLGYTNGAPDGCLISGSVTSTLGAQVPAGACGGVILESWTYTDYCNRVVNASRTIHVSPATLPTMTVPATITVACGGLPAPGTIPFSNGLQDGCLITGTSNLSSFTTTPPACGGIVTQTWTATDPCGRVLVPVSRSIVVNPATLPTMTPLANITVECGGEPAPSSIQYSNGLQDGCLITGTSNLSSFTTTPGACGGTITETWTATDPCGRVLAPVSRTITVNPAALPVMIPPENITVACGGIPAPSTLPFSNGLRDGCLITGTSDLSTLGPVLSAIPGICGGSVLETWTGTDACNRPLAPVSRTITVMPAALPTMTPLANITVACGGVPASSTIPYSNGLQPGCTITGTSDQSTFSTIPGACGGIVTETWTATDPCNRPLASVSRTITVSPAALPTMTPLANITVACGGLPASSTIPYSNGLTDGCAIAGTSNSSTFTATPGPCGGTVTETWTATDACQRALASVSRTITVSPALLPWMTPLANITVACGGIPAPVTIPYGNGLTDGCLISGTSNQPTFSATPGPCGGTVTETWTATDACQRSLTSVSRTITVNPALLPWMTPLANITVACGGVPASSTIPYSNGLTDGCAIAGTSNPSTFTTTPGACGGTVTETWTATDQCQRALTSVSRTITVSPAQLPTMTPLANITVACGGVPAPSTIPYSNTLSDGCHIAGTSNSSTFTATPGPCGGTVTETWTATDPCNRPLAPVSRTITVSPAALPTMTPLANITVACGGIPASSTIPYSNGLTDGCAIAGTSNSSTFTATPGPCGGTVTETWTATDACQRTLASVSRTITVSPALLPWMTPLANITVACGGIPAPATIPYSNGLTDGCAIAGTSNQPTFSATPGPCGGIVTETWTATDQCQRALTAVSRTITVNPAQLPTMTPLANITVACGGIPAPSTIQYSNGLTDGCAIAGTSNASTFSATPGPCGGTVTETWTATDPCQRPLAPVSRTITVNPAQLPTMSPLTNITVACGGVPASSTIPYSNGLQDGCAISGTSNSSTFSAIPGACGGTVTETWTATDPCNRPLAPVNRTITVSPAALPTMTAPADITVTCVTLIPAASTITYSNGLTDGCLMTGTSNLATFVTNVPGSCNGQVTETWTATDACGRTVTPVSRIISIIDNIPPVITQCASNQTVYVGSNCLGVIPDMRSQVQATDNCFAAVTINQVPAPGSTYGPGDVTVTFTAEDACSNISTSCTAIVHILYNTISGTLLYNNSGNTPLNGVVLSLMNGNTTLGTATTVNGNYSFTSLCASGANSPYTVVVTSNPYPVGSINSTDAGQANYWWTHTGNTIQKVRFFAGDVMGTGPNNPDYIINSIDALNIQLFFVNNGNHAFNRSAWSYFTAGANVTSNSDPNRLGSTIAVSTTPGTTTLNLLAECTGDFNMSYMPGNMKEASAFELIYSGTQQGDTNLEIQMPVKMVNPAPVSAVSMVLNFPADLVNITDVTMKTDEGNLDWAVNGNELRIGWYSTLPFNVDALGDLLTIKLKTTAAFTPGKSIRLTLVSTSLNEIADANYNVIPNATVSVPVIENAPAGINPLANQEMTFQNHPNPFANLTTFTYNLPASGNAIIEIHDLLGRVVMTALNEHQTSGPHILQVDATTLPMGIYVATLKLVNNDGVEGRTIKIVETK